MEGGPGQKEVSAVETNVMVLRRDLVIARETIARLERERDEALRGPAICASCLEVVTPNSGGGHTVEGEMPDNCGPVFPLEEFLREIKPWQVAHATEWERDEALARVRRLASKLAEAVEPYRAFVRDWLEGDGVGVDQARALLGGTPTKEGE